MTNPHGSFVWYELMTSDTEAAGAFYAEVAGWRVGDFPGATASGAPGYRIFSAGDAGVAGMMAIPADAAANGMRPGWFGYVGVDDVDATVARITAAGGAVHMPATDLPGVGRMAMLADPQGVVFYVMRGASDQASTSFDATANGHCAWNELAVRDLGGALGFYTGAFGWVKGGVMDMGPMGDYQFIDHAGVTIGAMMTAPPGPPPGWTFYFRVADIDAAVARVTRAGGTIMHGPMEVPGGDHIIVGGDPQGATFALVGARVAA